MICPQCGTPIPEGSKFCGACGATIENQTPSDAGQTDSNYSDQAANTAAADNFQQQTAFSQQDAYQNNMTNAQPQQENYFQSGNPVPNAESQSSKRGLVILGGIAIVAVVVIVLLFKLLFGSSKTAWLDAQCDYYNDRDTDVKDGYLIKYGEIWGEFKYEQAKLIADLTDEDDWEDDFIDNMEDKYDSYDDHYGDDWEVDYELKREKEVKKSKLNDYQDRWEEKVDSIKSYIENAENNDDYSDKDIDELTEFYEDWIDKFEDMEVTEGYTLTIKFSIEGEDDKNRDTDEVTVVKLDGTWVPIDYLR